MRCKITVLKRSYHRELVDEYLEEQYRPQGPCECFREGQTFLVNPFDKPGDVYARCPWAWADIYKDVLSVASGANMIGLKQSGTLITSCTDWFRPVLFKIERISYS